MASRSTVLGLFLSYNTAYQIYLYNCHRSLRIVDNFRLQVQLPLSVGIVFKILAHLQVAFTHLDDLSHQGLACVKISVLIWVTLEMSQNKNKQNNKPKNNKSGTFVASSTTRGLEIMLRFSCTSPENCKIASHSVETALNLSPS